MDRYSLLVQALHVSGVELTSQLQIRLVHFTGFFIWVSKILDPCYAYLFFSPLILHYNKNSGIKILWTAAIAEWLNHVLKWVLFGERPYWWVHEHANAWGETAQVTVPEVKQFSNTCETGPGSPSGHVMITGAALYILVRGILELLGKKKKYNYRSVCWAAYITVMVLVAVSRIFIGAHFPHQCAAGLLMGIILGHYADKIPVWKYVLKVHVATALGTLLIATGTYLILLTLRVDPNWTIPLAIKWCAHREWVHLNTTPFYMMWRYAGTILGIGFALDSKFYRKCSHVKHSPLMKIFLSVSGIAISIVCASLIPDSSVYVVYCSAFVIHTIIPILTIAVLPWSVVTLSSKAKKLK